MVSNEKWFGASAGFYPETINQSLRFEDGDSSYLMRTPTSTGDRKTWTISYWLKIGNTYLTSNIISVFESASGNKQVVIRFYQDKLYLYDFSGNYLVSTNRLFRDTSNWYHMVWKFDSTQGTSSERIKLYINGTQETDLENSSYPSINHDSMWNHTNKHIIGARTDNSTPTPIQRFDGYLAEFNLIDGQALEPEAFGQTKNGVWIPAKYSVKVSQIAQGTGTAIGDMPELGGNAGAFNGTRQNAYSSSAGKYTTTTAYIGKNWGSSKTITGFILYSPTQFGFGGSGASTFTVKLYGSNSSPSNGTDGTLLYTSSSVNDNLVGSNDQRGSLRYFSDTNIQSEESISNFTTTAFSYHWVLITLNTTESIHVGQIEFYEDGASNYYGTNGFRLTFDGNGTATTAEGTDNSDNMTNIGDDKSGQGHNFSRSGLLGSDVVKDSPTNNFCTLNPNIGAGQKSSATYSEGNLKYTSTDAYDTALGTFGVSSGKWYFETRLNSAGSQSVGLRANPHGENTNFLGQTTSNSGVAYYRPNGNIYNEGSGQDTGFDAGSSGDIIQVAFDADNGYVWFGVDNTFYGTVDTATNRFTLASWSSGEFIFPAQGYRDSRTVNFGQDGSFAGALTGGDVGTATDQNGKGAFKYTPPSGYLALCSSNLPDTTISPTSSNGTADEFFNTVLYTGNGYPTSDGQTISGVGFQPDWVWLKSRSLTFNHSLYDSTRGATKELSSNVTTAEATEATFLTAFNGDGFVLGAGNEVNQQNGTFVSWNWRCGGSSPTKTYKVVVVSDSGNKFRFRNSSDSVTFAQSSVTLNLQELGTYRFDVSDSSMSGHALKFSTTSDGIHGGGSEYTTGVTSSGTSGQTGAYVQITVASSAPTLYYYCAISGHSGMGGQINTNTTHGSTNFDGSILSVSQTNETAGFSIVTYTGNNGSSGTIGHGLNIAPEVIILFGRTVSNSNVMGATSQGWTKYASFGNVNGYFVSDSTIWNNTAPTTTVFSVGGAQNVNDAYNYVAYCFHSIEGYSAIGKTYTGNSSTDGTFVYTGFRPAWILIKRTNGTGNYFMLDNKRIGYNGANYRLVADDTLDEYTGSNSNVLDIVSNGFKLRQTSSNYNTGNEYIYMAFAEQPFHLSNAR